MLAIFIFPVLHFIVCQWLTCEKYKMKMRAYMALAN